MADLAQDEFASAQLDGLHALRVEGVCSGVAPPPVEDPTSKNHPVGHPILRDPKDLRLHPLLHNLIGFIDELNDAARIKDCPLPEPVLITIDGFVLAGFGRWQLSLVNGDKEVHCIECPLNEEHAVGLMITYHRPHPSWNAFIRILLALTLEPRLQEKALRNMRIGGECKGSSTLTKASRLDVRKEIAKLAHASVGNISKVKQILKSGCPELQEATKKGEISINRAENWCREAPAQQVESLRRRRIERIIRQKARELVSSHVPKSSRSVPDKDPFSTCNLARLASQLARISEDESNDRGVVAIKVVDVPGKTVYVTKELIDALNVRKEEVPIQ